jgi:hypothetical protein
LRVLDSNAWQHAYKLIATDASDHVVGTQACSQRVRHGDEQYVPSSVARGVVRGFEPIYVDIGSHELSADALRAIDLAPDGRQPSATAARSCQLVGPGIFTVLGGLCAIFGCNLAVMAALCAIFGCNLAVVDGSYAAVRSFSTPRVGTGTFVCRALSAARRAIPCGSVEITRRVVPRFGFSVTQPGRDVTVPRSQPGIPPPQCRQLVGPGILAILGGLRAIFGCNLAVVDGSYATVRSLSAPGVGTGTFVCRALTVARRAIPCGSVAITRRVVTRFGLPVTQPGRDVAVPRSQPGLPTAHCRQLVGPGILAVLGGLCAVVRCNLAVIDGSYAAVRSLSAPRVGTGTFVCRAPTVARRAIPCGSVEITRCVVTLFGLSVTQLSREVTRPRSQPGSFAVLGGLCAIFGCKLAVVDGLGAVVRSLSAPRGGLGTFGCRALTVARRAIACGSVEITRRVVARFGLSVTQPGRDVTVLRSQPGLPAAHSGQLVGPGILAVLGGLRAILGCNLAIVDGLGAVVRSPSAPRGGLGTFVCRMLTVARRAVPCGSVEITRRVVTRFGLSVTLPGRDVTALRSQPGLPAAHSGQLVGPGILAVLGGLRAIFGCNLAVVNGLGAVVRSLIVPRGSSGTFACRMLTLASRAVTCGSVEITRRVITRFGLSVTQLGREVTHVRSQIAVTPFYVALACRCKGVFAFIRATAVLIRARHSRGPSFSHVSRSRRRRAPMMFQCRPIAITIAATETRHRGFIPWRRNPVRTYGGYSHCRLA